LNSSGNNIKKDNILSHIFAQNNGRRRFNFTSHKNVAVSAAWVHPRNDKEQVVHTGAAAVSTGIEG
jgi:hypothetical protein